MSDSVSICHIHGIEYTMRTHVYTDVRSHLYFVTYLNGIRMEFCYYHDAFSAHVRKGSKSFSITVYSSQTLKDIKVQTDFYDVVSKQLSLAL